VKTLGVAFFDFSRLAEWTSPQADARAACLFQEFYVLASEALASAGATVVKFMGDAGLAVFEPASGEAAILALCELTRQARQKAMDHGFDAYLNVNIHVGPVVAGRFGPSGGERFDVIGKAVNVTARLGRRGVTLSPQAFRTLSPQGRKRFEKIMQPITYRLRQ
jgi:class 3 adenylate cyclase